MSMRGDQSKTSRLNKNFLVKDLGLKQYQNSTIFKKNNMFVLSPVISNDGNCFELRKMNLDRLAKEGKEAYLLIRLRNKFLLADLYDFIQWMVDEQKASDSKESGIHWKYSVKEVGERFTVHNLMDRYEYHVEEISKQQLKVRFTGFWKVS